MWGRCQGQPPDRGLDRARLNFTLLVNYQTSACQALYGLISCLIVGVRPSALGTFQRAAAGTKHSGTAVRAPLFETLGLGLWTSYTAHVVHNRFSSTRGTFPDPELACHDDVAGSTQCKGHTPGERRLPVPNRGELVHDDTVR